MESDGARPEAAAAAAGESQALQGPLADPEVQPPPPQSQALQARGCGECSESSAKYKCPACGVRTCSLKCVKAHKQRTGCSGVRDRTAFVPMDKMGDREMFSDIALLDDIKRVRDVARKSRPIPPRKDLPHFLKNLRFQARKRGVRLLFLQPGMKRRGENTSFHQRAKDQLFWRVEWQFAAPDGGAPSTSTSTPVEEKEAGEGKGAGEGSSAVADRATADGGVAAGAVTLVSAKVLDSCSLADLLQEALTMQKERATEYHKLLPFVEAGLANLCCFLPAHKQKEGERNVHEMLLAKSLGENLVGKTIVEFPVISVRLKGKPTGFTHVYKSINKTERRGE